MFVSHQVLSPVDITVIGNGPQGKDHHVDISITDFIMTISPSTIRLLSAVAAGLSVPPVRLFWMLAFLYKLK